MLNIPIVIDFEVCIYQKITHYLSLLISVHGTMDQIII
jgi:hypothetical protein